MSDGKAGGAKSVAVTALGEEMNLGGDFGVLQGLKVDESVLFVDGIVFGLQKEGWRGSGGGNGLRSDGHLIRPMDQVAWVEDEGEVGAGADCGPEAAVFFDGYLRLEVGVDA